MYVSCFSDCIELLSQMPGGFCHGNGKMCSFVKTTAKEPLPRCKHCIKNSIPANQYKNPVIEPKSTDKKFTSGMVTDWLQSKGVSVLEWAPYSPDLNPIEHIWAEMKRRVEIENVTVVSSLILNHTGKAPDHNLGTP